MCQNRDAGSHARSPLIFTPALAPGFFFEDQRLTEFQSSALSLSATSRPWSFDMGSIDIACLSTAVTSGTSAVSVTQYGKKATLALAGGGLTYTTKAVMQRMDMVGKVNDITRYALSFKITPE